MLKATCGSGGISNLPALSPASLSPSAWLANFKWHSYLGATWSLNYLTSFTS